MDGGFYVADVGLSGGDSIPPLRFLVEYDVAQAKASYRCTL